VRDWLRAAFFFLVSYLVCNQIWLKYFINDHHFGYIPNSLKETLLHHQNGKKKVVFHTVALPFTLKSILRQKKNYGFAMQKYNLQNIL
jgi:hypothetical protein